VHRVVWSIGAVVAVAGLGLLFVGYTVERSDPASPDVVNAFPVEQARCSMPVRQVVAEPHQGRPTVSDDVSRVAIPNVQPLCRQVGVWRFSTGMLLVVLGLGVVGVEATRLRRTEDAPSPSQELAAPT